MAVITEARGAAVIALKAKRKAARAGKRKDALARTIVALWSGFAMLATLLFLGTVGTLALRHGALGLGITLGITCLAGWAIAGRLLRPRPQTAPQADIRAIHRTSR
jgi:hypothetical protein